MVTAGKARKFAEPDDERVSTRRDLETQSGVGRGNDNLIGAQPFSGQGVNPSITQSGLEDPTKVQVRGSQMSGALGFSQRNCVLNSTTKILDITKNNAGQNFPNPPTDVQVLIDSGTTSDLEIINFPKFVGHRLRLYAVAVNTITLIHTGGSTVNALKLPNATNFVWGPGVEVLEFSWSIVTEQWHLVTGVGPAGGAINFANQTLSNLSVGLVRINTDLEPDLTANAHDLGSSAREWNDIFFAGTLEGGGANFGATVDFNAFFADMDAIAIPANPPAGTRRIFVDTTNSDALSIKRSDGTVASLEAGAGAGFANTALSNLTPTSINEDLDPISDGLLDLGIASLSWNDLNIDRIIFRHNDGILSTFPSIGRSSNALRLNSPTGNATTIEHAGVPVLSIGENFGTRIDIAELASGLRWLSGAGQFLSIIKTGSSPALITSADGWLFDSNTEVEFANGAIFTAFGGGIDMNANDIVDVNNVTSTSNGDILGFRNIEADKFQFVNDPTVVFIEMTSGGIDFNAGVGDFQNIKLGGVNIAQFVDGGTTFFKPVVINGELTISGLTDAFMDISDIPIPAQPISGLGRIFLDNADNILKIRHDDGVVKSLEASGVGSQTPWLSDINADQNELFNIAQIRGRDTGFDSFRIVFDANEDSDTYITDGFGTDTMAFFANASSKMLINNLGVLISSPLSISGITAGDSRIFFKGEDDTNIPTPGAEDVFLFVDKDVGTPLGVLFAKKSDGSLVNLEAGATGGNLWSDPVDANIIPDATNARDLGSASNEFRDIFSTGIITSDEIVLRGPFTQSIGDVNIDGETFFGGDVTFNGLIFRLNSQTIFIGDDSTANINLLGRINSSLIPDDDNEHDIGIKSGGPPEFETLRWRDLFMTGKIRIDAGINTSQLTAFSLTSPQIFVDNVVFSGDLRQTATGNPNIGFFGAPVVGKQVVTGPPGFGGIGTNYTPSILSIIKLLQKYGLA